MSSTRSHSLLRLQNSRIRCSSLRSQAVLNSSTASRAGEWSRRAYSSAPGRGAKSGAYNRGSRTVSASFAVGAGAAAALALNWSTNSTASGVQCDGTIPAAKVGNVSVGGGKSSVPDISALRPTVLTDSSASMRTRMETYVKLLQYKIVSALTDEETGSKGFFVDTWLRKEGGEGISCILQDGETFEKAGVNISIVHGSLPPRAIQQMSADHAGLLDSVGYDLGLGTGPVGSASSVQAEVKGLPFYATGLSLVVHPRNPHAPTVHFNYRYFELTHPPVLADGSVNPRYDPSDPTKPCAWWFGGGTDLTPMLLYSEDAEHFHEVLKSAADKHETACYPAWKRWCDRYFYLPHRGETRGVGGIFFDDLTLPRATQSARILLQEGKPNAANPSEVQLRPTQKLHDRESLFALVRELGDAFLPAYLPILQRRTRMATSPEAERWQRLRRGRYVEFNLLYDRGTKFGLQTPGARIESILMSLPLEARWEYVERHSGVGQTGSEQEEESATLSTEQKEQSRRERETMKVLRKPQDWA
ncbi:hypothetical protein IE81DRAFT_342325 [Ceraceosorus guamensis]|uniref:coproporphyrinogen oxidase n=1 Tax=Ceraceosorus guamensis TaxID=1522189 RepID=A0A316VUW3_9BASI|nr:hypothetical protein IE81DRAFT_342325 [Ceraceosorus guamensis]PWN41054.1 hypothetical protein IE81DRAFT_342325 [Ceraceosorus guamensis]